MATFLDIAKKEGEIIIKRKVGSSFIVSPINSSKSPLDVDGINTKLSAEEIVSSIREVSER